MIQRKKLLASLLLVSATSGFSEEAIVYDPFSQCLGFYESNVIEVVKKIDPKYSHRLTKKEIENLVKKDQTKSFNERINFNEETERELMSPSINHNSRGRNKLVMENNESMIFVDRMWGEIKRLVFKDKEACLKFINEESK